MDIAHLTTLSPDILGIIVGYLDDASYVSLHYTCPKLYRVLRSAYLLRVFFGERCSPDITLSELRVGLRNISRYTTYTFLREKTLINHYLRGLEGQYLVDIFERVWLCEANKWYPSTVNCDRDRAGLVNIGCRSLPRYGFVYHDTFTITREDLSVLHQIHHVQVLLQTEVILYRQWEQDMIYFSYRGGFPYQHIVPIDQVVFILARAPPDWSEKYVIDLILDRSGHLYLGSELILSEVQEMRYHSPELVLLMKEGELRYCQLSQLREQRWQVISKNVRSIVCFDNFCIQYLCYPHTFMSCNRSTFGKRVIAEDVTLARSEHCYISQDWIRGAIEYYIPPSTATPFGVRSQSPVELSTAYGHTIVRCQAK